MKPKVVAILALVALVLIVGGFLISTSLGIAAVIGVAFSIAILAFAFSQKELPGTGDIADEVPTDEVPTDEVLTDEVLTDEVPTDEGREGKSGTEPEV
jgi:hypothetical protein